MINVQRGDSPVILAQPHGGTVVPASIKKKLNRRGQKLADTDWHINRLYGGLLDDATVISTNVHRYVIDVNRPPDNTPLYPGQHTTELCPTTDFDGAPIYLPQQAPSWDEIESRWCAYHIPYHAALAHEIERVKRQHGMVILYDCHSIRSVIPFLFAGKLPAFNIGTNNGKTCIASIEQIAVSALSNADDFSMTINGRFKGGWTVRHHGKPETGVNALQMELAQRTYMKESPPWTYHNDAAQKIRSHLARLLNRLHNFIHSENRRVPSCQKTE